MIVNFLKLPKAYFAFGVLISSSELSSFLGVGIEEFHCIQRCPHFRGLE